MLLTPFSASAPDERTKSFVSKYVAANGEEPNQFAADAYDGIYALYTAVQNAGITPDTSAEEACEKLIAEFAIKENWYRVNCLCRGTTI